MSVVVKDNKGQIWLYTKGAESHVLPLCNGATNNRLIESTQQHINEFAKQGLRTLAVARRKLTADEYSNFSNGNVYQTYIRCINERIFKNPDC